MADIPEVVPELEEIKAVLDQYYDGLIPAEEAWAKITLIVNK